MDEHRNKSCSASVAVACDEVCRTINSGLLRRDCYLHKHVEFFEVDLTVRLDHICGYDDVISA